MGLFTSKKEVKLEDFCREFYNMIISSKIGDVDMGVSHTRAYAEVVKNLLTKEDDYFNNIDIQKMVEEFILLRFELFALVCTHKFVNGDKLLKIGDFTKHFLQEKGMDNIWDNFKKYNELVATGTLSWMSKLDGYELVYNSTLKNNLIKENAEISNALGINEDVILRENNRLLSENAWKQKIIPFVLINHFCKELNIDVNSIKPSSKVNLGSVIMGFYDGAKDALKEVKIMDDMYIPQKNDFIESKTEEAVEKNEEINENPKRTGNFWKYSKTMGRDEAIDVYKMWLLHARYYHPKLDALFNGVSIPTFFLPVPMELLQETSSIIKEFTDENGFVWTEDLMDKNLEKYAYRYYPRTGNDEEIIRGLGRAINNKNSLEEILQKIKENKEDWYFEYKEL